MTDEGHGSGSEWDENSVVPAETASPAVDDTVPVYQDTVQDAAQDTVDEETVLVTTANSVVAESPLHRKPESLKRRWPRISKSWLNSARKN